jgi:hypothetical protein
VETEKPVNNTSLMSSTKRNKEGFERATFDYYPTPEWVVHRLLEKISLPGGVWFEPCAGDGAIVKAVNQVRQDVKWDLNEIQPDMCKRLSDELPQCSLTNLDYRTVSKRSSTPKVVITNPPFALAMEFIEKSLELDPDYVVFLLRLNFLASKARAKFMSSRPSFIRTGQGDSVDYAWFVWSKTKQPNQPGKLVIIPTKD